MTLGGISVSNDHVVDTNSYNIDILLSEVWDRRALSETNPQPVGVLAGHMDGITFIDTKVGEVTGLKAVFVVIMTLFCSKTFASGLLRGDINLARLVRQHKVESRKEKK